MGRGKEKTGLAVSMLDGEGAVRLIGLGENWMRCKWEYVRASGRF